jgi:hypothetical protein
MKTFMINQGLKEQVMDKKQKKDIESTIREIETLTRNLRGSPHDCVRMAAQRLSGVTPRLSVIERDLLVARQMCSGVGAHLPWHIPGRANWLSGTAVARLLSTSLHVHDDACVIMEKQHLVERVEGDLGEIFDVVLSAHSLLVQFELLLAPGQKEQTLCV